MQQKFFCITIWSKNSFSKFVFCLINFKLDDANPWSRAAFCGLCTRYFKEAKTIMEGRSISIDDNNRLSQLISLLEKRLTELQTINEKIHSNLNVDKIEEAIVFSADLNDQIFINIDTTKRFLERLNQESESSTHQTTTWTHVNGTSSAARTNTRLPKLNYHLSVEIVNSGHLFVTSGWRRTSRKRDKA